MKKKIILGSIIAAVCAIAIIVISVVAITQSGGSSSKKSKKQDLDKVAEEFTEAVKTKENMDDFLEKYLDKKALYAYISEDVHEAETAEEYVELFEKKMEEFDEDEIQSYMLGFEGFTEYGLKMKLKDTESITSKDCPDFNYVKATYEDDDGVELCFYFDYYKGKLYMLGIGEGLDYLYEDTAYYSGDKDIEVNLTTGEKIKINKKIIETIDQTEYPTGTDIKAMIDAIIEVDEEYMDEDVFVGLYVKLKGKDTYDLSKASTKAKEERTTESKKAAIEEMKKVRSLIENDKEYHAVRSINHGIILEMSVSDEESW